MSTTLLDGSGGPGQSGLYLTKFSRGTGKGVGYEVTASLQQIQLSPEEAEALVRALAKDLNLAVRRRAEDPA